MKNLIFPGLFMLLFSLLSTAGFGQQKPTSSATPQKLLPCEEAVKAARKTNRLSKGYSVGDAFDPGLGDIPLSSRYEYGYFMGLSFNFSGN
jgi:hypothetical protein